MKQIFTTLLLFSSLLAAAQDGTLDITFGTNGKSFNQSLDAGSSRTVTFVQADGKILQSSNGYVNGPTFAVARYNSDGSIDNSFGTNGVVSTEVSPFQDISYTVTAQPDGKVIVGGQSYFISEDGMDYWASLVLIRYNVDGTIDNSFDGDGKMILDIDNYFGAAYNIRVLPNGKILVTGFVTNSSETIRHGLMARFNADGSIDNSFGTNGKVIITAGTGNDDIYNLAVQADGRIVLAGTATVGGHSQYVAMRFSSEGVPDNSFGTNGQIILNITNYQASVKSVAVQPDNKIIIAGNSTFIAGDPDKFTIVRLKADGSLDETFNGTGELLFNSSNRGGSLYNILIQQDNKIVMGGTLTAYNIITQRTTNDFLIMRLTPAGAFDLTLTNDNAVGQPGTTGASGQILLNNGTDDLWGNIAFQGTKLIVGGTSTYQPPGDPFERPRLAVARLNNNVGAVLPLRLMEFTATPINATVQLKWKTAEEIGTKMFEIERSGNGINFQKLSTIFATGNGHSISNYSFIDQHPFNGANYYRLKMIDADGKFSYSDRRKIYFNNSPTQTISCYPIPTSGLLNIQLSEALQKETKLVSILNETGSIVNELKVGAGSSNILAVDLSRHAKGVYFIRVTSATASSTQRVVLQ